MSQLDAIVKDLYLGKIPASAALDQAMDLMRGKVLDSEFQWLVNEHDGYALAEGEEIIDGIPAHLKPYRLVYADAIALRDPNGKDNHLKGWPQGENRLQWLLFSLADLEARLNEREGDYIYPPCKLNLPDVPAGFDARLVVHKSQVYRILERFKQEFIKLAGRTALGAGR